MNPSPLQLLQLGSYYNFPEGMAAVLLYRDSSARDPSPNHSPNNNHDPNSSHNPDTAPTPKLLSQEAPFAPFAPLYVSPVSPLHVACIAGASLSIRLVHLCLHTLSMCTVLYIHTLSFTLSACFCLYLRSLSGLLYSYYMSISNQLITQYPLHTPTPTLTPTPTP